MALDKAALGCYTPKQLNTAIEKAMTRKSSNGEGLQRVAGW